MVLGRIIERKVTIVLKYYLFMARAIPKMSHKNAKILVFRNDGFVPTKWFVELRANFISDVSSGKQGSRCLFYMDAPSGAWIPADKSTGR